MIWPKITVEIGGEEMEAIAPFIISASRATDIPAFYGAQFMEALRKGFLYWTNPFNHKKSLVSFKNTDLIVFWSKNPRPLFPYLNEIDDLGISYYFNFTLNDYEMEGFEPNLPKLQKRIDTFIELSEKIGREKMIWRFDPVIISRDQNVEIIIDRIEKIACQLEEYTNKLVFSFVDTSYRKVQNKLVKQNIQLINWGDNVKCVFSKGLTQRLMAFNLEIASCAEKIDLTPYKIYPNKCIDNKLIKKVFSSNEKLVNFISELETKKKINDKGQRKHCQCMVSKDIGRYNTCGFSCVYCYAMLRTPT